MRARFFRFGLTAAAMWAAVCSPGSRLQAMQAETSDPQQEFAFFFENSTEDTDKAAEQHEAPKFWLGITLKPIEGDLAKYLDSNDGVLVDLVFPESPASVAGLMKGDIIVAVGDEKLTDPKSLLTHMLAVKADDAGKVPAMKLTVMRKGESKAIELTPVFRPADKAKSSEPPSEDAKGVLGLSFDLNDKSPEEIEQMIEKLHGANANLRILRFGAPAKVPSDSQPATRAEIHRSVDGKNLEIKISREGDAPAKITVTRDGETKEYSSDKMDDMPEDIRKMVIESMEKGQVQSSNSSSANDGKAGKGEKRASDRIAEIRDRITLIAPELKNVMDKEMSDKIRTMAKEIEARALEASKWAQTAAAMPEEIKQLKSQVESLRAEIKELREQLKAPAK